MLPVASMSDARCTHQARSDPTGWRETGHRTNWFANSRVDLQLASARLLLGAGRPTFRSPVVNPAACLEPATRTVKPRSSSARRCRRAALGRLRLPLHRHHQASKRTAPTSCKKVVTVTVRFVGKPSKNGSRSRRCSAKVVLSRSTSLEPPRWRSRPSAST